MTTMRRLAMILSGIMAWSVVLAALQSEQGMIRGLGAAGVAILFILTVRIIGSRITGPPGEPLPSRPYAEAIAHASEPDSSGC